MTVRGGAWITHPSWARIGNKSRGDSRQSTFARDWIANERCCRAVGGTGWRAFDARRRGGVSCGSCYEQHGEGPGAPAAGVVGHKPTPSGAGGSGGVCRARGGRVAGSSAQGRAGATEDAVERDAVEGPSADPSIMPERQPLCSVCRAWRLRAGDGSMPEGAFSEGARGDATRESS